MTSAIQDIVYDFYTTGLSVKDVNNAILMWQADLGYISSSITQNWMAIAQDNDIKYLGDLDMQNGFATGRYSIQSGDEPLSFDVTAANGFDVLIGFNADFTVGSISRQPITGHTLTIFYSLIGSTTTIQFSGDVTGIVAGKTLLINGVPLTLDTDWTYDSTPGIDVTAAGSNTEAFPTEAVYTITWQ